ncbi:MAG: hypothetical protein IPN27_07265 [Cellvibrionales bacterium]|nr:hypothetical protein [Cellvibrionales bacterium]
MSAGGFINEARLRYVSSLPLQENGVDPRGFIGADLAVNYKAEAHYGDRLKLKWPRKIFPNTVAILYIASPT